MEKHIDEIRKFCIANNETIATAESVTAGYIQWLLSTAVSSQDFFQGGITVYNCAQKTRHLGVEPINALKYNGVESSIALRMARECCRLFCSSIGIGITGFAAPDPKYDIQTPFSFIAIVYKETPLYLGKVAATKSVFTDIQKEYALTAISLTAEKLNNLH